MMNNVTVYCSPDENPAVLRNKLLTKFKQTAFRVNQNFIYEFNFQTGQLNEYTERRKMPSDVMCMALGTVPPGEQRSWFLAVGLADNTVRIISLDPSVGIAILINFYYLVYIF